MGALKNIVKPFVFIAFPALLGPCKGPPGRSLEVLGAPVGSPWGSLGVPGMSLGGSEWSMGVDVSATDHIAMYTMGNIMLLWSPLGLRHSLGKLRHLLHPVVIGPPTDTVINI